MENKIKVGDLVRLKSGSPTFIVTGVENGFVSFQFWNTLKMLIDYGSCQEDMLEKQ